MFETGQYLTDDEAAGLGYIVGPIPQPYLSDGTLNDQGHRWIERLAVADDRPGEPLGWDVALLTRDGFAGLWALIRPLYDEKRPTARHRHRHRHRKPSVFQRFREWVRP